MAVSETKSDVVQIFWMKDPTLEAQEINTGRSLNKTIEPLVGLIGCDDCLKDVVSEIVATFSAARCKTTGNSLDLGDFFIERGGKIISCPDFFKQ